MTNLLSAILIMAAPAAAQDNAGVNAVYDRMAAAYAARDRAMLATIFHPKMVTSSSAADQPPVIGGAALGERVGAGLDRLKQQDRQAELRFRVSHRGWADDTAVDVGVLRMRTWGGGREPRTVYSRVVSTLVPGEDGTWVFLTDSPAPATQADWDKAEPVSGAKFDR